ncbi:hypothetical protein DXU07_08330 [Bradyrhizobium elkanii]|nr:hypothetical protein [Bradyrhizobium elkanii]
MRTSDFNPIENAFAKLKALLRQAAKRTVEGLWTAKVASLIASSNRMPQLLHRRRIRCNMIGECSSLRRGLLHLGEL